MYDLIAIIDQQVRNASFYRNSSGPLIPFLNATLNANHSFGAGRRFLANKIQNSIRKQTQVNLDAQNKKYSITFFNLNFN